MRLIDADAIPWDVDGVGFIPVIGKDEIDEMPEGVVRCKDCRWWGTKWKMKAPLVEYGDCLHLKDTSIKSDFFCAFGERREDAEE